MRKSYTTLLKKIHLSISEIYYYLNKNKIRIKYLEKRINQLDSDNEKLRKVCVNLAQDMSVMCFALSEIYKVDEEDYEDSFEEENLDQVFKNNKKKKIVIH